MISKNVSCSFVKQHGIVLMALKDGEVIFPKLTVQSAPGLVLAEDESDGED